MSQASEPIALELTFEPTSNRGAMIRWEADVLGKRQSQLVAPFDEADQPLVLSALDYLQSSKGHPGFSAEAMERLEALGLATGGFLVHTAHRMVGTSLFKALTVDQAGSEALGTVRNAATAAGANIEIHIHFPPEAVELASLPWELLWDSNGGPLLLTHERGSTLTRHLDLATALPPPRPGSKPLRILPIVAHAGISEEERREERSAREQAWATLQSQGDAEMLPEVSPATSEALFDQLDALDAPPDIVHFVGHGKYLDGQGHLVLDKVEGGWEPTPVSRLAPLLKGVRLVVLANCQSATLADGEGPKPTMLTGAATAVSAVGVPLVLAMQLTVRTTAAYRLLEIFYRNVARGRSVQEALSRARQGLHSQESDGASWYVPVLYMRSRERGPALMVGGQGGEAKQETQVAAPSQIMEAQGRGSRVSDGVQIRTSSQTGTQMQRATDGGVIERGRQEEQGR